MLPPMEPSLLFGKHRWGLLLQTLMIGFLGIAMVIALPLRGLPQTRLILLPPPTKAMIPTLWCGVR